MSLNPPRLVVMGVSGCGKSTVGQLLATALGVAFLDGDALHPESNIAKMAAGQPLDDADREPWLEAVGQALAAERNGLVVACSALKRSYRDLIRREAPGTGFVLLTGSRELLQRRVNSRPGHFMPASLLDSQLATLEPLGSDEGGVVLETTHPVPELVAEAVEWFRNSLRGEGEDATHPGS